MSDDQARKKIDWKLTRRFAPYLKPHWLLIGLAFLALLAVDLLEVWTPILVKTAIDKHIAVGDLPGLLSVVKILVAVMLGAFIGNFAFNYLVQYLGQRVIYDLRLDLFSHLLSLDHTYFDSTPVGKSLTSVTNDVEALQELVAEGIVPVLGDLLKLIFICLAMIWINWRLALLALLNIPVFILITILFRKGMRSGYRGVRKATAEINTALVETITGMRELILFQAQPQFRRSFKVFNQDYLTAYLKVVRAYSIYFPVVEVVSTISMVLILLYAHFAMGVNLLVGEIFAFFAYITMFFRPLRELAERFNIFQSALAAAERIFKLKDRHPVLFFPMHAQSSGGKIRGAIHFDQVHFAYKPDAPVLTDLSFSIQPGERIAFVGHTGSGKTTIINLLNRFYDRNSGMIQVDGIDIREYDLHGLRSQIATVPQDVFVFTGSIADNISLFNPAISRDRIIQAAENAQVHQFIKKFAAGYDENVLEEGKLLSAGEKQLLGFARALLKDPAIVILDEATARIDSETEHWIAEATQRLLTGRTAIIIAHRLSTIKSVDRILVLHKGHIVEAGNHRTLLRKRGLYHQLYKLQAFSLQ